MLQLHVLAQLTQVVHIEDLLPKLEAADRGQGWVAERTCFSSPPPRSGAGLAPSWSVPRTLGLPRYPHQSSRGNVGRPPARSRPAHLMRGLKRMSRVLMNMVGCTMYRALIFFLYLRKQNGNSGMGVAGEAQSEVLRVRSPTRLEPLLPSLTDEETGSETLSNTKGHKAIRETEISAQAVPTAECLHLPWWGQLSPCPHSMERAPAPRLQPTCGRTPGRRPGAS